MHALSCHVSLDAMEQELDGVLEDAKVLGLGYGGDGVVGGRQPEAVARAVRVPQAAQSAAELGMGCASCTTTIPMSCAPWTAARAAGAYHGRLCRWRRICTGCFTRVGPCALFAREQQPHRAFASRTEKSKPLPLCVGRRRGRYPGDLPCRSRLAVRMADR